MEQAEVQPLQNGDTNIKEIETNGITDKPPPPKITPRFLGPPIKIGDIVSENGNPTFLPLGAGGPAPPLSEEVCELKKEDEEPPTPHVRFLDQPPSFDEPKEGENGEISVRRIPRCPPYENNNNEEPKIDVKMISICPPHEEMIERRHPPPLPVMEITNKNEEITETPPNVEVPNNNVEVTEESSNIVETTGMEVSSEPTSLSAVKVPKCMEVTEVSAEPPPLPTVEIPNKSEEISSEPPPLPAVEVPAKKMGVLEEFSLPPPALPVVESQQQFLQEMTRQASDEPDRINNHSKLVGEDQGDIPTRERREYKPLPPIKMDQQPLEGSVSVTPPNTPHLDNPATRRESGMEEWIRNPSRIPLGAGGPAPSTCHPLSKDGIPAQSPPRFPLRTNGEPHGISDAPLGNSKTESKDTLKSPEVEMEPELRARAGSEAGALNRERSGVRSLPPEVARKPSRGAIASLAQGDGQTSPAPRTTLSIAAPRRSHSFIGFSSPSMASSVANSVHKHREQFLHRRLFFEQPDAFETNKKPTMRRFEIELKALKLGGRHINDSWVTTEKESLPPIRPPPRPLRASFIQRRTTEKPVEEEVPKAEEPTS